MKLELASACLRPALKIEREFPHFKKKQLCNIKSSGSFKTQLEIVMVSLTKRFNYYNQFYF